MSGLLLVVCKLRQLHKALVVGVVSWEIRSAGTSLLNASSSFPVFTAKKPRTNLPSCIQIPNALSFADVPCGVPSLLCFAITGPVIAIRMPQHAPTALVRNSDTATTSTLLKTIVVGSPSRDLCNPAHLELSQSYADAIQP